VVAAEPDGTIVDAGWPTAVEETIRWANAHRAGAAMLFVDAPPLVLNPEKQSAAQPVRDRHPRALAQAQRAMTAYQQRRDGEPPRLEVVGAAA
jgi:ABC-type nitrate/sulfonate/bicarbonate transport system substrate-binding protein